MKNMIFKIVFFVIFLLSFNSCTPNKKTDRNQTKGIPIPINTFVESDENYKEQILSFVRNHIKEGYYVSNVGILFLKKNENGITIQNFNKINNEEIYTEIITFNILHGNILHEIIGEGYNRVQRKISTINNEYIYNELYLTTEKRRWVDGSIELKNNDYRFKKSIGNHPSLYNSQIKRFSGDLYFLSSMIDEEVIKYTYDYQKQFVGKYVYDSYMLFGIDTDEFNAEYNNEYEKVDREIDIDDNGFLFEKKYNWKTKIIDENQETMLFGNTPAYGASVHLYFFNGEIIWEVDLDNNDMKYQLIFKRQ